VFVLNCNFELGVLDECVAIAVTNSMCTDLPVVHYFPYFVDQCTLRSAFCDYFMSTVFSFDVLLKWARRNDAVCIFESTKIPEIGGRGRRVFSGKDNVRYSGFAHIYTGNMTSVSKPC